MKTKEVKIQQFIWKLWLVIKIRAIISSDWTFIQLKKQKK